MGYSTNPNHVRVDFFKEHGKWCETEVVKFLSWRRENDIVRCFYRALGEALRKEGGGYRYEGMWAVCLEPYHELSFPLMVRVDREKIDAALEAAAKGGL